MSDQQPGNILIVDDEENMRSVLQIVLQKDGHDVDAAESGPVALAMMLEKDYDLVIQDINMPEMDGLTLLRRIKDRDDRQLVVVITAFSTWDSAVEAMRLGAYDYIRKPFDNNDVRGLVQRALRQKRLFEDTDSPWNMDQQKIIGTTPQMQDLFSIVRRVAPTDSTVVIQGESGTGKELIARLIHDNSLRAQSPIISVNCGAFSETLLESELFGHIKGAFTGAVTDKKGLLDVAQGGSFFLDELGEMPLHTQVRFLRLLENREYTPVGGTSPVNADVRFITATNRDLDRMLEEGDFREDLYFRLNVINIRIPPLRERTDDIPLLAGHFLALYAEKQNKQITGFDADAIEYMVSQDWPGNIRELENTVQRAVTLTQSDTIGPEAIAGNRPRLGTRTADGVGAASGAGGKVKLDADFNLDEHMAGLERRIIEQAMTEAEGNMTRAAELLGISFRQIRYKVKKLGVET